MTKSVEMLVESQKGMYRSIYLATFRGRAESQKGMYRNVTLLGTGELKAKRGCIESDPGCHLPFGVKRYGLTPNKPMTIIVFRYTSFWLSAPQPPRLYSKGYGTVTVSKRQDSGIAVGTAGIALADAVYAAYLREETMPHPRRRSSAVCQLPAAPFRSGQSGNHG